MVKTVTHLLTISSYNSSWIADNRTIVRHLAQHNSIRANARVIPDAKRSEHLRTRPDDHIVANRRVTLSFFLTSTTERYALIDNDIIANHTSFTDYNTHPMIDKQSLANFSTRMNFNTSKKSTDL